MCLLCCQFLVAAAQFRSAIPYLVSFLILFGYFHTPPSSSILTSNFPCSVYSWIALSKEKWYAWSNLGPLLYFGVLITLGYASSIATVVMLAKGE